MIEGITILSQTEMTDPNVGAFVGVVLLFVLLGIGISILAEDGLPAILFLLVGVLFGAIVSNGSGEPNGTYEYKVLIDDSVSINQVLEEYEIISQEGLIYTITERENEDD